MTPLDKFIFEECTDGSYTAKKDVEALSESSKLSTTGKAISSSITYINDYITHIDFTEVIRKSNGNFTKIDNGKLYNNLVIPFLTIISNKAKTVSTADLETLSIINQTVDNLRKNQLGFETCYKASSNATNNYSTVGRYIYEVMSLSVITLMIEVLHKMVVINSDTAGNLVINLKPKNVVMLSNTFLASNLKRLNTMITSGKLSFILAPNNFVGDLQEKLNKANIIDINERSNLTKDERIEKYLSEEFSFAAIALTTVTIFFVVFTLRLMVAFIYLMRSSLAKGLESLAKFIELNALMAQSSSKDVKDKQLAIANKIKQYATWIEVDVSEAEKNIKVASKNLKSDFMQHASATDQQAIDNSGLAF